MTQKIVVFLLIAFLMGFSGCGSQNTEKSLFDEKNIGKWKSEKEISFSDDVLTLSSGEKLIYKSGKFTDFELTVSVKTSDNGKGMITFHTDGNGENGYSVAIDNDEKNKQWWTKTGSLLSVRNLVKPVAIDDKWFDLTLRVFGKEITVTVNDNLLVEYIEPQNPFRTTENSGQVLTAGTFAISCTEGVIKLKNAELVPLKANNEIIAGQLADAIDETEDEIIKLHQLNFPVLDYHVHLKDDLTLDVAKSQSRKFGINYALAPNCGIGFPITNEKEVDEYLEKMKDQPFLQAMQGEGREWPETFSKRVRDKFDYVFTDALTFTDRKGNRTRLWIANEVFIDDEQQYMDLIVEKICKVILEEPFDIYVNPTFLPEALNDRYDMFWTDERQYKVIDALVKSGKVLEINEVYKIPNKSFILKAKDAGLKFSLGTNNINSRLGKLEYALQMVKECGITADDMYNPVNH